ncbi:MAG: NADPH-dependent F420 reductase [Thermaurantiacus sp.]
MKIVIIGAGNVGSALSRRLSQAGHDIVMAFGRSDEAVAAAAQAAGVAHGSVAEAVQFGEVIVLTVPWAAVPDALASAGDLSGRILWDCTNPMAADLSGLLVGGETSGGEEVARMAPGARVVKGIPPFAQLMHADDPTIAGTPPGLFVAGDDEEARKTVAGLLGQLPANVRDAGPLMAARFIEPAMLLLVRLAYLQGMGPRVALSVQSEAAA